MWRSLRLLAGQLGLSRGALALQQGERSRLKTVSVEGLGRGGSAAPSRRRLTLYSRDDSRICRMMMSVKIATIGERSIWPTKAKRRIGASNGSVTSNKKRTRGIGHVHWLLCEHRNPRDDDPPEDNEAVDIDDAERNLQAAHASCPSSSVRL